MGNRAIEKDRQEPPSETGGDPNWPHPFDRWLRRELQGLYRAAPGDPLPDEIANLAAQLEERLTAPEERAPEDPAEDRDESADPGGRERQG